MMVAQDKVIYLLWSTRGEKVAWFSDLSFEIASVLSTVSEPERDWSSSLRRPKIPLSISASTDSIGLPEFFKEKRKKNEEQRKVKQDHENKLRNKWQLTDDSAELDKVIIDQESSKTITTILPPNTFKSFSEVKLSLPNYNGKWVVPTVIFIGNQGSGKSLLISSILSKSSVTSSNP
jgi:hypothetical protein